VRPPHREETAMCGTLRCARCYAPPAGAAQDA